MQVLAVEPFAKDACHSSCYCAQCFLRPNNHQWLSQRVFCSHTQVGRPTDKDHKSHVCGGKRLPILAFKSFSKNAFSRVVIRAHSLFKPVVLLFSAIRSPRGPLGPLSRLGLRFVVVVVVVLGDQISTGAPRAPVEAGAEICCGCCCSRRSDLHGGPSGPCRGWG